MASNPMQKKSRNAFLLGMLLMLIISAIIIVILVMVLGKNNKKEEEKQAAQTYVYRLKTAIKSGEEISNANVESVLVNTEVVPDGASASKKKSTDKDGKDIWSDIGFSYSGYKAKIDLPIGTIVCDTMLYEGEELQSSERIQEYNVVQMPIQLDPGEYVDIRLQLSNGQDYIVVSHKEVKDISSSTIWLQLSEAETLLMSNAIVESYISPASNLYMAKYVEAGMQEAAQITYVPSTEVIMLIRQDENIVKEAKNALIERYNQNQEIRGYIQSELNKFADDSLDNIQAGMIAEREKAQEAREAYLNGVN